MINKTTAAVNTTTIVKAKGITHNGIFHADDVFAAALLDLVYPGIKIQRVRDLPENIEDDTIVFDIGGGQYDHHQQDAPVRKDGTPYAAFGLLWREFGPQLVGSAQAEIFDADFVSKIDATDNGGAMNPISLMVSNFNPAWDEKDAPVDRDAAFEEAVIWAKTSLSRSIVRMQSNRAAEELVTSAYEAADDKRIVVLDRFAPWQAILTREEQPVYVVFPSLRGGWNANCVPVKAGSRENRKDFPSKWLEAAPAGLTFLHKGLFLLSADSCEAAVELCRQALEA